MAQKLVLIDGNTLIHRGFHALPPLKTKAGELVNAVLGFTTVLLNIFSKEKPDYAAVALDTPAPTFRHEKFREYKATRVKAPQELYDQIPRIREIIRAFSIPIFEKDGYEADDVIASLAEKAHKIPGVKVIIVTGDRDILPLVNQKTEVIAPLTGFQKVIHYTKEVIREKYGLKPAQLVDYKALCGDPSDNIPGISGIGPKSASLLLSQFGRLEKIYQNLEKIPGNLRAKLVRDREKAFLSKELVTLVFDLPLEFDLKKCQTHQEDKNKVRALFQKLEFSRLLKKFEEMEQTGPGGAVKGSPGQERGEGKPLRKALGNQPSLF